MSVEAKKLIDFTRLSRFKELMDQSVDGKLSRLKIDLVQIVSVLPELDAAEEGVLYWVPAKGDGGYEIWAKENVDGTPTMVRNFSISISGDLEGFLTEEDAKATYFNRVTVADATITFSRPDGSTVVITVNNVAHATKADQDGTGAVITATYATKAELTAHAAAAESAYVQTGAVDQTIAGTKTFSKPIVGSVTGSSGSCTGNAATATTAANGVDSSGGGWIRFKNGIQICWAAVPCNSSGSSTWTYGASFSSRPVVTVCDQGGDHKAIYLTRAGNIGTTSCLIVMVDESGGSYMAGKAQCIAIGRWK